MGLPNGPVYVTEGHVRTRRLQTDPVYASMIASLDDGVGRVLRAVHDLGLDDNTIIVFTSDNGGLSTAEGSPTSNFPLRGGKGWLYEGGIREPLLVSYPGRVKPGVSDTPVIGADFFPTLLALAGLNAGPGKAPDGIDFSPALAEGALPARKLFWHYPHYSNQGGGPGSAVRDGDFKLIQWFDGDRVELYNLADDPGEQHDLAAKMPEKVAAMKAALDSWRASVHAKTPSPNPNYHGDYLRADYILPLSTDDD